MDELFSPTIWDRVRYTEDGTQFGEGLIWAVGLDAELVGVYYNKDIFEELNLGIPESVTELEETMQLIKEGGYTPISVGILDDWQFFHLYGALQLAALAQQMGADTAQEYLDDIVVRSKADRSWLEAGNVESARILQNWVENGYLVDGFTARGGDDAISVFLACASALFIQGSWYSSSIAEADFESGFFPFPPMESGGTFRVPGENQS